MPDKVVKIPGVGNVAFPDSMSQADIDAASAKLYKEKQGAFGVTAESGAAHLATGPENLTDTPTPDAQPSSFMDWLKQPITKERLNEALSGASHPQTLGDFLSLLVPSGVGSILAGSTGGARSSGAVGNVAGDIAEGVKAATASTEAPNTFFAAASAPARYATQVAKQSYKSQVARHAAEDAARAVTAEAAPVAEAITPAAQAAPAASKVGPIYHPEPTMQTEFAKKAAERKAAADAAVDVAKKATKAPKAPVLGKNVVTIKNGVPYLTPDETHQALQWLQDGVTPDKIIERLNDARELQDTVKGTGNLSGAQAEVRSRRQYIQYPKNPKNRR